MEILPSIVPQIPTFLLGASQGKGDGFENGAQEDKVHSHKHAGEGEQKPAAELEKLG